MNKRLTLITSLCLWLSLASAVNLDSLWGVWNDKTQPDTNRLKAMQKIAWDGYLYSQPDSAFYLAQLQYDFAKSANNKKQMAAAVSTQGESHRIMGNYEQALEYYDKSIAVDEETGDKHGMAASCHNIGLIYADQDNYEKALDNGKKAFTLAQEVGKVIRIRNTSELLYGVYKKTGQPAKALEMHELYIEAKDSIINEENTKELVRQEYKYKYEKEQAIDEARHQEEINLSEEREKRLKFISNSTATGLIMVILFAFFIYNRFKLTKKQKEALHRFNLNDKATLENVKSKYKKLAKIFHPDLNKGNKRMEEEFKKLTSAYKELQSLKQ